MAQLQIIVGSTRPGRAALPIARWAFDRAVAHGGFEVELVDLEDYALPVLDEPRHPRMGRYEHEHTKRWSAKIADGDAFVFVTPEYNYGPSVSLLNAFDYLSGEWQYKPVGFVSYGGLSGGLRSVQVMKQIVTTVKMMPVPEGVAIPMVMQHLGDNGFTSTPILDAAVPIMLDELLRWEGALEDLRHNPPPPPPMPPMPPPNAVPAMPKDREGELT
jgi:NAD(P)H-dependent FMN reductase